MKIEYNNKIVDVEIIGGFKVNQKEYAVCSYEDSDDVYKIIIVEVVRDGGSITTKNIPNDEIDLVLETYRKIENKILDGGVNE